MSGSPYVALVLRAGGAAYFVLFAAAVLGKVGSWNLWKVSVRNWSRGTIPEQSLLIGLPLLEGLVATLLIIAPAAGLGAASFLLGLLSSGVVLLVPSHRGESCACFGTSGSASIGVALAARNAILSVAALLLGVLSLQNPSRVTTSWPLLMGEAVAMSGVGVVLEFLRVGDLRDEWRAREEASELD